MIGSSHLDLYMWIGSKHTNSDWTKIKTLIVIMLYSIKKLKKRSYILAEDKSMEKLIDEQKSNR